MSDATGTAAASHNYSPYGVPDAPLSGFAFTGEQRDTNGLQYHRARYYRPNLGIFLSLDPFEGISDRPMSLNGYSWVEGNVVNATDASGKCIDTLVSKVLTKSLRKNNQIRLNSLQKKETSTINYYTRDNNNDVNQIPCHFVPHPLPCIEDGEILGGNE